MLIISFWCMDCDFFLTSSTKCTLTLHAVVMYNEIYAIGKSSRSVYFSAYSYCYSTFRIYYFIYLITCDFSELLFKAIFAITSHTELGGGALR